MTADEVRQHLNTLEGGAAGVPVATPFREPAPQAPVNNLPPVGAPVAPIAPQAPSAPTAGVSGESLDKDGLPWDERIHAGSKQQNKDGSWKKRKGVKPDYVAAVEAELRQRMQAPFDAPRSAVNTAPGQPILGGPQAPAGVTGPGGIYADIPAHMQQHAPQVPAPAAPAAFTPPTAAPAPVAPPARDFAGLMQQMSNLYRTGRADNAYPDTIVQRINSGFQINTVTTLTDIANEPNMVEYAWQCLEVDGKAN